jgi:hypothetical protein
MDNPSQKQMQKVPDRQIIGNVDGTSYDDAEACTHEHENLMLDEGNDANTRLDANKRNKYLTCVAGLIVGALLVSFISFYKAPNGEVEHAKAPRSNPSSRRMEPGIQAVEQTRQSANIEELRNIAHQQKPISDKFTAHTYQTMYGTYLMPLRNSTHIKMLEIGLGCNMGYGPGASVKLWRIILPHAEMWEAEYNKACVNSQRAKGNFPKDLGLLVGDQSDPATLERWIKESGGNFDVVIDDGGHTNKQVMNSFDYLWPQVKPGGLYFIEDLQVGRTRGYEDTGGTRIVSEVIQAWTEQLIISAPQWGRPRSDLVSKHPLPKAVESIFCQHEACVLVKQSQDYPGKEWK